MNKVIQIDIDRVRTNGGTQVRVKHDRDAINEYSLVTDQLPPIVVFFDGKEYWLADGFQRLLANLEAGNATITAEVINGTQRDAILYALKANADGRGVRLNNDDRKKGREMLLTDPEWSQWSDRELAKRFPHLGTDKTFASVRIELEALATPDEKEPDDRAKCNKCRMKYAPSAIGRTCSNDTKDKKCGGLIVSAETPQIAKPAKKRAYVRRGKKHQQSAKKPKPVNIERAAIMDYFHRVAGVIDFELAESEKYGAKRMHGLFERMKESAAPSDKRRLLA